jgi:adenylylsulfate kinase-like enzyme
MVIWMVGLSGAGKTTIGRPLYERWKKQASNTVLVDGDEIRKIFKHDQNLDAYTVEGRRVNGERISEICAWLDRQGINVVCCILSIFEDMRIRNRQNFSKYFEVYLSAPMEVLEKRDTKGLYASARRGEQKNVVGVDIPFPPPANPDMVIDTSCEDPDFQALANKILQEAER